MEPLANIENKTKSSHEKTGIRQIITLPLYEILYEDKEQLEQSSPP